MIAVDELIQNQDISETVMNEDRKRIAKALRAKQANAYSLFVEYCLRHGGNNLRVDDWVFWSGQVGMTIKELREVAVRSHLISCKTGKDQISFSLYDLLHDDSITVDDIKKQGM